MTLNKLIVSVIDNAFKDTKGRHNSYNLLEWIVVFSLCYGNKHGFGILSYEDTTKMIHSCFKNC